MELPPEALDCAPLTLFKMPFANDKRRNIALGIRLCDKCFRICHGPQL